MNGGRRAVLAELIKTEDTDVLVLQETHDEADWGQSRAAKCFPNHGTNLSAGVAPEHLSMRAGGAG